MELGQQIKQARESKNLSQEELAAQLGVSRQAVSKWENGSAIPQGLNRDMLSQILGVELSIAEGAPVKGHSRGMWLGWALAAVLLCVSVAMGLRLFSAQKDMGSDNNGQWATDGSLLAPTIKSVQFYDKDQNVVRDDGSMWYNAAEIDSILVQWEGGTPNNIQVFCTPTGTETEEQTELLMTKSILDGDTAALLNGDALDGITMGHVYFELNFGGNSVASDLYNMFFDLDPME